MTLSAATDSLTFQTSSVLPEEPLDVVVSAGEASDSISHPAAIPDHPTAQSTSEPVTGVSSSTAVTSYPVSQNFVLLSPDSVAETAVDSSAVVVTPVWGLTLEPPETVAPPEPRPDTSGGVSFISLALFLLFALIGIRFHNNRLFIDSLLRNLVEVKERGNLFDDTVRETSFLLFLNLMWCCCTGVALYRLLEVTVPGSTFSFPPGGCMGICIGVAAAYMVFISAAVLTTGTVFADLSHARIWLRGLVASQGILGFFYFPLALAMLCYPGASIPLLWVAAVAFILARLTFIWKGMRIFFTEISSWVLFLYYLCSLEIVPLILTYFIAAYFCRI